MYSVLNKATKRVSANTETFFFFFSPKFWVPPHTSVNYSVSWPQICTEPGDISSESDGIAGRIEVS